MITVCGFGDWTDPEHRAVCLACAGAFRRALRAKRFWATRFGRWLDRHIERDHQRRLLEEKRLQAIADSIGDRS